MTVISLNFNSIIPVAQTAEHGHGFDKNGFDIPLMQ